MMAITRAPYRPALRRSVAAVIPKPPAPSPGVCAADRADDRIPVRKKTLRNAGIAFRKKLSLAIEVCSVWRRQCLPTCKVSTCAAAQLQDKSQKTGKRKADEQGLASFIFGPIAE